MAAIMEHLKSTCVRHNDLFCFVLPFWFFFPLCLYLPEVSARDRRCIRLHVLGVSDGAQIHAMMQPEESIYQEKDKFYPTNYPWHLQLQKLGGSVLFELGASMPAAEGLCVQHAFFPPPVWNKCALRVKQIVLLLFFAVCKVCGVQRTRKSNTVNLMEKINCINGLNLQLSSSTCNIIFFFLSKLSFIQYLLLQSSHSNWTLLILVLQWITAALFFSFFLFFSSLFVIWVHRMNVRMHFFINVFMSAPHF